MCTTCRFFRRCADAPPYCQLLEIEPGEQEIVGTLTVTFAIS
jgi:hypothetical protein